MMRSFRNVKRFNENDILFHQNRLENLKELTGEGNVNNNLNRLKSISISKPELFEQSPINLLIKDNREKLHKTESTTYMNLEANAIFSPSSSSSFISPNIRTPQIDISKSNSLSFVTPNIIDSPTETEIFKTPTSVPKKSASPPNRKQFSKCRPLTISLKKTQYCRSPDQKLSPEKIGSFTNVQILNEKMSPIKSAKLSPLESKLVNLSQENKNNDFKKNSLSKIASPIKSPVKIMRATPIKVIQELLETSLNKIDIKTLPKNVSPIINTDNLKPNENNIKNCSEQLQEEMDNTMLKSRGSKRLLNRLSLTVEPEKKFKRSPFKIQTIALSRSQPINLESWASTITSIKSPIKNFELTNEFDVVHLSNTIQCSETSKSNPPVEVQVKVNSSPKQLLHAQSDATDDMILKKSESGCDKITETKNNSSPKKVTRANCYLKIDATSINFVQKTQTTPIKAIKETEAKISVGNNTPMEVNVKKTGSVIQPELVSESVNPKKFAKTIRMSPIKNIKAEVSVNNDTLIDDKVSKINSIIQPELVLDSGKTPQFAKTNRTSPIKNIDAELTVNNNTLIDDKVKIINSIIQPELVLDTGKTQIRISRSSSIKNVEQFNAKDSYMENEATTKPINNFINNSLMSFDPAIETARTTRSKAKINSNLNDSKISTDTVDTAESTESQSVTLTSTYIPIKDEEFVDEKFKEPNEKNNSPPNTILSVRTRKQKSVEEVRSSKNVDLSENVKNKLPDFIKETLTFKENKMIVCDRLLTSSSLFESVLSDWKDDSGNESSNIVTSENSHGRLKPPMTVNKKICNPTSTPTNEENNHSSLGNKGLPRKSMSALNDKNTHYYNETHKPRRKNNRSKSVDYSVEVEVSDVKALSATGSPVKRGRPFKNDGKKKIDCDKSLSNVKTIRARATKVDISTTTTQISTENKLLKTDLILKDQSVSPTSSSVGRRRKSPINRRIVLPSTNLYDTCELREINSAVDVLLTPSPSITSQHSTPEKANRINTDFSELPKSMQKIFNQLEMDIVKILTPKKQFTKNRAWFTDQKSSSMEESISCNIITTPEANMLNSDFIEQTPMKAISENLQNSVESQSRSLQKLISPVTTPRISNRKILIRDAFSKSPHFSSELAQKQSNNPVVETLSVSSTDASEPITIDTSTVTIPTAVRASKRRQNLLNIKNGIISPAKEIDNLENKIIVDEVSPPRIDSLLTLSSRTTKPQEITTNSLSEHILSNAKHIPSKSKTKRVSPLALMSLPPFIINAQSIDTSNLSCRSPLQNKLIDFETLISVCTMTNKPQNGDFNQIQSKALKLQDQNEHVRSEEPILKQNEVKLSESPQCSEIAAVSDLSSKSINNSTVTPTRMSKRTIKRNRRYKSVTTRQILSRKRATKHKSLSPAEVLHMSSEGKRSASKDDSLSLAILENVNNSKIAMQYSENDVDHRKSIDKAEISETYDSTISDDIKKIGDISNVKETSVNISPKTSSPLNNSAIINSHLQILNTSSEKPHSPIKKSPLKRSPLKSTSKKCSPSKKKLSPTKNHIISQLIKSPTRQKFRPGQILWGRVGNYPYWPCIICTDERGIYIAGNRPQRLHIKFFADNGRHAWIASMWMLEYKGLEDFFEKAKIYEHSPHLFGHAKGRKKNINPFQMTPFRVDTWTLAVNEAETIAKYPIEKRIAAFDEILDEIFRKKREEKRESVRRLSIHSSRSIKSSRRIQSRSPTPESPPFEPILSPDPKRFKADANAPSFTLETLMNENVSKEFLKPIVDPELPAQVFADNIEVEKLSTSSMKNIMVNNYKLTQHLGKNGKQFSAFFETFKKSVLSENDSQTLDMLSLEQIAIKYFKLLQMTTNSVESEINIKIDTNEAPPEKSNEVKTKISPTSSTSSSSTSSSSPKSQPVEIDETNVKAFTKNYLFRDLPRDYACRICFKTENVYKCDGICCNWFHKECCGTNNNTEIIEMNEITESQSMGQEIATDGQIKCSEFLCDDCYACIKPPCFICQKYDDQPELRMQCKIVTCGKYYHKSCLKYFPQTKIISEKKLYCPTHCCHTCVSDDPRSNCISTEKSAYVRCVKCPATYHMDSTCIPAGSEFISAIQIICPKHRPKVEKPINANWCFICAVGGSLICCETCPTAFHIECLNINIDPDQSYICEECETGRMPLYGEIVWAKFGVFRWWPSQIIPPSAIPDNIEKLTQHEFDFCIKFFGANNYGWVNRDRVYLYQEGDWGKGFSHSSLDTSYQKALMEAKVMYEKLKSIGMQKNIEKSDKMKPIPYIKISINKPIPPVKIYNDDLNDKSPCNCNPDIPNPCSQYSGCINRILMYECNSEVCPAGEKCENQMFEKRLYPKTQVVKTESRGWGLYTCENIAAGTFVIEYVGEIIDDDEFNRRVYRKQLERDENYYFLTLNQNSTIDAGPRGNVARFMNHSCDPNCETQKWRVNGTSRVGIFAIKDIPDKTELTFNYNLDCMGDQKKICHCGAKKCAGFIGAKYRDPELKNKRLRPENVNEKAKPKIKRRRKKKVPVEPVPVEPVPVEEVVINQNQNES